MQRPEGTVLRTSMPKRRFDWTPWVLFGLLALTFYVFWIKPWQEGSKPVVVEFEQKAK